MIMWVTSYTPDTLLFYIETHYVIYISNKIKTFYLLQKMSVYLIF